MNITESLYCNTVILYHETVINTTANHTKITSENFKYIINITYPSVLVGKKKQLLGHPVYYILPISYIHTRTFILTLKWDGINIRLECGPYLKVQHQVCLCWKLKEIQHKQTVCFFFLNCASRRKERCMDWPSPNQWSCMFVHKYHPSVGQSFMTWTIHFSNYFQHSGQTLKN